MKTERCPECLSDSHKHGNMRPCTNDFHAESVSPAPQPDNKEAYDACLKWLLNKQSWGTLNAMSDDGYDPNCNYVELLNGWKSPVAAQVKRYNLGYKTSLSLDMTMLEEVDGDYVLHSDYGEELGKMETAAHQLTKNCEEQFNRAEKAESQVADMRKALQKYANRIDWFEVESTSDGDKYQAFACPGKYGYEIAEKALEKLSEVKP